MGHDQAVRNLTATVIRGGLARVGAQGTVFLVRMVSLMVFARLLAPGDFGLLGMVTGVTGVLGLFKDFGLSTATVQRGTLTATQSSTLFWLNLLVGAILCLVTVALAPVLAAFYHEPRLWQVTLALSLVFPINAAGVQHTALLQREMRFVTLAALDVLALCVSSVVGVGMALRGSGYWALVGWSLLLPAVTTTGAWVASAWVPGRPRRGAGITPILVFGGTVTVNTVIVYVAYNLDKVLVGWYWGPEALGLYGRAYQLLSLASDGLIGVVGGVAFAALSRVSGDHALWKNYFLKGYKLLVTSVVPVAAGFMLFAEELVLTVLGPQWRGAATPLRLLAPILLVFGLINPTGWLLFSAGMVRRSLAIALAITVLVVSCYGIGLAYGPVGVAAGFSAAMLLWVLPHMVWSMWGTGIALREVLAAMRSPMVSGLLAGVAALAFHLAVGPTLAPALTLVLGAAILMTAYVGGLVWLMKEKAFYVDVLTKLTARSAAPAPRA